MTNSTSITMNEQDRQEIIRDAQSYYRDDKALINHSYLEHASAEELNELKLMKKIEIRRQKYNKEMRKREREHAIPVRKKEKANTEHIYIYKYL